ncbi:MAG: hypothetical protein PHT07_15050 [Paludibacter sp.]|nr:hypothetical protein [Paludibacter sp.]
MEAKVISKVIAYGDQRYQKNSDGTWWVLAFGTTITNHSMHWNWISIPEDKVPATVKNSQ